MSRRILFACGDQMTKWLRSASHFAAEEVPGFLARAGGQWLGGWEARNGPAERWNDMDEHHRVVVVGGGNAGISLAARLLRKKVRDVAIIEPRSTHYFQPLFSHIGAGAAGMEEAQRPQAAVMPRKARWIQEAVSGIRPEEDAVVLGGGRRIGYDQ